MLSVLEGVKQGVLAAKPEELILGAYNTPILLLWLPEEHVEGEERRGKPSLPSGRAAVQDGVY